MPEARELVLAISSSSVHPVSLAVAAWLEAEGIGSSLAMDDLAIIPRSGFSATFRGYPLLAGRATLREVMCLPTEEEQPGCCLAGRPIPSRHFRQYIASDFEMSSSGRGA